MPAVKARKWAGGEYEAISKNDSTRTTTSPTPPMSATGPKHQTKVKTFENKAKIYNVNTKKTLFFSWPLKDCS